MKPDFLNAKMELAIICLFQHRHLKKAAIAAGISPVTLWRWMRRPLFRRRLFEVWSQVNSESITLLRSGQTEAANTLIEIMKDPKAPVSSRIRAAIYVTEQSRRVFALDELSPDDLELENVEDLIGDPEGYEEQTALSEAIERYRLRLQKLEADRGVPPLSKAEKAIDKLTEEFEKADRSTRSPHGETQAPRQQSGPTSGQATPDRSAENPQGYADILGSAKPPASPVMPRSSTDSVHLADRRAPELPSPSRSFKSSATDDRKADTLPASSSAPRLDISSMNWDDPRIEELLSSSHTPNGLDRDDRKAKPAPASSSAPRPDITDMNWDDPRIEEWYGHNTDDKKAKIN